MKAEDAVKKVKRQVGKSAAALLLESRIGEQFDSFVTGTSAKGTWVRLLSVPVEGKLVQGFEDLEVGDRVGVQLTSVDVQRGFIDFKRSKRSRRNDRENEVNDFREKPPNKRFQRTASPGSPPLKRKPISVTQQQQGDRYEYETHKQSLDRA